jgi:predicted anti-sigma-YlaC factor YlaD
MTSRPMPDDLSCQELVELVTDYLEEALPAAQRARVDEHLIGCPFCGIYLDQMRATIRAVGHVPEADVSPEALQALLEVFRRAR